MRQARIFYMLTLMSVYTLPFSIFAVTMQDATRLSEGEVAQVVAPQDQRDLQDYIQRTPGPIAVAGAQYSQGGQVWADNATVIDIRNLNRIIDIDIPNKTVTVESGATWRDVQEVLNPVGLSPQVMQSYNDFTIGGSLSVNVHGRDTTGSIIKAVHQIVVLLPDGTFVTASRQQHPDIFYACIGGYGGCGIITQATMSVTDNVAIRRQSCAMHISEYISYLRNSIIDNSTIILHNANVYPPDFTQALAVNWISDVPYRAERSTDLICPHSHHHVVDTVGELMVRRLWGGQYVRQKVEHPVTTLPKVTHRNNEIGRPVATLSPWTQMFSSNILQEYFIPLDHVTSFIHDLKRIQDAYSVNILNASLRYVPADTETVLSYAPHDCCSVVLYINIVRLPYAFDRAQRWTQELIDAAVAHGGTYYLPYHLFASQEQFQVAYPQWERFLEIKQQYDPDCKLSNQLLDTYIMPYA